MKKMMTKKSWSGVALGVLLAGSAALYGCGSDVRSMTLNDAEAEYLDGLKTEASSMKAAPTALPEVKGGFTEMQYMIQLGEDIIRNTNTHALTASYIPNSDLTCSSCHRDAGKKKAIGSTFIGAAASFPAFNGRDGGVITLQDRINSCFMRSMNGTRLPANSEPLLAMTTYITWLSEGTPIKMNAARAVSANNDAFINADIKTLHGAGAANVINGEAAYLAKCASCHAVDGLGIDSDSDGHFDFPPVWGPGSFNKGAGLANNFKGGSWIQFNMPPGEEFTLANQEALDIMAYINTNTRPAFVEEDQLPAGGLAAYDDLQATYHYGTAYPDKSLRVPVEVPAVVDGATLYDQNCAGCHGTLAASTKLGATAGQIQAAIGSVGSMNSLSLTSDQITAIAEVL